MRLLIAVALLCGPVASGQTAAEPTKREIENAYRSKMDEGGATIPGLRWERWRIKEIRGWSLKFKHLHDNGGVGILTRRYQAVAKKNGSCAEYQITDRWPLPPANPQIKPSVVVEPSGVTACR